jgi:hypothetical protein
LIAIPLRFLVKRMDYAVCVRSVCAFCQLISASWKEAGGDFRMLLLSMALLGMELVQVEVSS